ncbi:MAG: recombinase RecA [candidate division WOR-3 bacterium]|nr:recombinase RecA [candidate division WOR-3 bacterium]MCX7947687.1 recombinase RecA [candidate division WOR-3 bacterium]MDW8150564.1 recombinase RecA [candidate division WOR-3 bacterium]
MEKEKDKEKILEATIKQLEKNYGKGIVMRLVDRAKVQVPTVSSGSISLDYALGIGGYPKGRIIEIYGQEASGKTTLALMAIAEVQKLGGSVLFIDAEHAFEPKYAKTIGVDTEDKKFLISQPEYGEQALSILEDAIRGGAIDLVVVDSVAALVTKAELEGEMEEQGIGGQARLMSKALRKLTGLIAKTGTIAIFINQVREKISQNPYGGPPETTPGGRALKFYSSIRLEVKKGESIKGPNNEIIGHYIKVKVVKNKLAPPYKTAEFELIYGKGINKIGEIFDLAVNMGIIKRSGSWYSFNSEQLGQGKEKALEYIQENEEILRKIETEVREKLKEYKPQGGEYGTTSEQTE